ncbi:CLUMA_CG002491, isoform A, partial [Clunio marinus]
VSAKILNLDEHLKQENLENHATLNHSNELRVISSYLAGEKSDEFLEEETRGLDFKGNVRYFCPKCNVRYIEFKYLKTHLKECGNVHECQICQQKFKQKRTYTAHMKKKHEISASIFDNSSSPRNTLEFIFKSN